MGIALEIKDDANSGLTPSARLVKALQDEEDRGMAITRSWNAMWRENLEYFFSEQTGGRRRHKDWDWIVVNYIWPSSMQEVAKISRQQAQYLCDPREPGDAEAAEAWQGWLQWMWERGLNAEGMEIEQLKAILCGKIYGYRVYKLWWEDRAEWDDRVFPPRWVGEVKGRLWKPTLFWATGEESIQDGSVGTVRYVDLEYALARWPDYKAKLKDEADRITDEFETGSESIPGQSASTSATYPGTGRGGQDRGPDDQRGQLLERILQSILPGRRRDETGVGKGKDRTRYVKLSERWGHDFSETDERYAEPIPIEELLATKAAVQNGPMYIDAATGEPLTAENWPHRPPLEWKQPKFPRGRYILRAGETTLNEDEEEQKYPYRQWPFITCPHYVIPFMWQGSDAVQLVKPMQDMINVSVSHLVNHMKQFGDPRVAVERGAIDSPKARDKEHFKIGSGAGAIIRLVRGGMGRVKILDPPSSSPVIGMLYQIMSQEYKNMVGLQDIAQGKKSAGDLTATESSYLAMSAGDRVHLQSLTEKNWILRIGLHAADIAQRNYEPDRLIRILGENAVPGVTQITSRMKDVKYDLKVEIGSALPFDAEKRIARHMQANQLLQAPPTPLLPELLRVLEIPNWRKILERHQVWVQWMGILQLIEAVRGGKMPPEQALQRLMHLTAQMLQSAVPQGGPAESPQGPGQTNETERGPAPTPGPGGQ
jgi:hypothetical protein